MHSQYSTAELPEMERRAENARRELRIGFVMSTELGLKTQYLNWRNGLADPDLRPEWIVIEWWQPYGLFRSLGGAVNSVITRIQAQRDIRKGMAHGPFDALFLAGHMLHSVRSALKRQPYFITLDTTRKQLMEFGALYGKGATNIGIVDRYRHRNRCEQYRKATGMFPWSHWCADSIVNDYGVDPARVHVIPPGIDLDYWRCEPRSNDGPVNLLFVGSNFERKGGDMLLNWAKNTTARDWRLHLVTRDPISTDDPRIKVYNGLTPNTPTLRSLYQLADIFVLPTRGDCYSIAGMEAMAAGIPVILARTGGTGDIIEDGKTGYLIEVGDEDAMTERLEHLIARPELRLEMGAEARLDAENRYDVRANISRTVQIMRQCISLK